MHRHSYENEELVNRETSRDKKGDTPIWTQRKQHSSPQNKIEGTWKARKVSRQTSKITIIDVTEESIRPEQTYSPHLIQ